MRTRIILMGAAVLAAGVAFAAGKAKEPAHQHWSFDGVFGTFDQNQLKRGFQVYKDSCAACHGMSLLSYRNLGDKDGPGFTEEEVKAIAKGYLIPDINPETGEAIEREGKPADKFKYPFANQAAGKAANGGSYPPDLSVIVKARHGGADYVAALISGYYPKEALGLYVCSKLNTSKDTCIGYKLTANAADTGVDGEAAKRCLTEHFPHGKDDRAPAPEARTCTPIGDDQNFNPYFAGGVIAMPAPLQDGQIEYAEADVPRTVEQYGKDVAAFLAWASDPKATERKRLGFAAILFLLFLSGLFYLSYRKVWRDVDH